MAHQKQSKEYLGAHLEEGCLVMERRSEMSDFKSLWLSTASRKWILTSTIWAMILLFVLSGSTSHSRLQSTSSRASTSSPTLDLGPELEINNRTLGFGKIYVMSLEDRLYKRDELRLMAAYSNIDLVLLPGFPLSHLQTDSLAPIVSHKIIRKERACYRSHLDAWSRMLLDGVETALFLEDDVDWSGQVREQLKRLRRPLIEVQELDKLDYGQRRLNNDSLSTQVYPGNWELLNLGACTELPWTKEESEQRFHAWPPIILYNDESNERARCEHYHAMDRVFTGYNNMSLPPRQRMLQRSKRGKCLSSYALTRRGAARLLYNSTREVSKPVDNIPFSMSQASLLNTFNVIPPLMDQWKVKGHHNSDIQPSKSKDRELWYPSVGRPRIACFGKGSLREQLAIQSM